LTELEVSFAVSIGPEMAGMRGGSPASAPTAARPATALMARSEKRRSGFKDFLRRGAKYGWRPHKGPVLATVCAGK